MKKLINKTLIFLFFSYPIAMLTGTAAVSIIQTISIILFLFLISKKNKIIYLTNNYSLFFFFFFVIIIISALVNQNYNNVFFYIRFWMFTLIIIFLLDNNRNLFKYFSIFFLIIFNFFILDGILQLVTGYNIIFNPSIVKHEIINGFFNDKKLGSALSRLFPIYLYLVSQNKILNQKKGGVFISCIATLIVLLFTKERIAILLGFITFLTYYSINFNKKNNFKIIIVIVTILFVIFFKGGKDSYAISTYNQIFSNSQINFWSKTHESYAKTSLNIFKNNMVFGSGPKTFQENCKLIDINLCSTHPHNFFFQILAELGVVGISFYIIFYLLLIKIFISQFKESNKYSILLIGALLFNFNPLLPSGSFFNSWLNCLLYFPLSFFLTVKKFKK
jgi:O-antigen ligase